MKGIRYASTSRKDKAELREAVLFLRYGPTKDDRRPKPIIKLADISKALNLSYNTV